MVGVHLDRERETVHYGLPLTCKFRAPHDLVLLCQTLGAKPYRGTPIGKVSNIYPFDRLRQIAIDECKQFVGHMRSQGYLTKQAETEMELWGPYREKVDMNARTVNIEEGNHLIPEGKWALDTGTSSVIDHRGPRMLSKGDLDNPDWKRGVVFLIRGQFEATHGKVDEQTGTLIV